MQLGADPDALEALGRAFDAGAWSLRTMSSILLDATSSATWTGSDRERVMAIVVGEIDPLARRAAVRCGAAGRVLAAEAAAQRAASRPTPEPAQRHLLDIDPLRGTAIAVVGDVEAASHIAVVVPGMGSDLASFPTLVRQAAALQAQASGAVDPTDGSVAVVAWLGYDAPAGLDQPWLVGQVLDAERAEVGSRALRAFLAGIARHDATLTVIGHSYGSLVVAAAARANADVDRLVVIGSPGLGVGTVEDLHLDGATTAYAGAFGGDPIAASEWFGNAPTDLSFGAQRLHTVTSSPGIADAHSSYFIPGSEMLEQIGLVVAGLSPRR